MEEQTTTFPSLSSFNLCAVLYTLGLNRPSTSSLNSQESRKKKFFLILSDYWTVNIYKSFVTKFIFYDTFDFVFQLVRVETLRYGM